MSFPSGIPATYAVGENERVQAISCSPRGNVMCILTPTHLQFWSALQHLAHLATVKIPRCTTIGDDMACKMVWHPQGRSIAVSTTKRRIAFFEADILCNNATAIAVKESSLNLEMADGASRTCFSHEIEVNFGIVSSLGTTTNALIAVTSAGGMASNDPLIGGSVIDFCCSSKLQLVCVVLSDSSVCVLRSTSGADLTQEHCEFKGISLIPRIGAVRALFNVKHQLISIGTHSVGVKSYSLEPCGSSDLQPFSPHANSGGSMGSTGSWCDRQARLGPVVLMEWNPEEDVLAVCFQSGGLATFHYTGVCLSTTFPRYAEAEEASASSLRSSKFLQILSNGCTACGWDHEGYRLIAAGPQANEVVVLSMGKVAHGMDHTRSSLSEVILHNETSICFMCATEPDRTNTILVPKEYSDQNFPIRFCTVSPDTQHLVVAGTSGCILYHRKTRRWRMFGMQSQEANISCVCAPCWVDSLVVILPVRVHSSQTYELQCYPRFHLDKTSLLASSSLLRRPLKVVCDTKLVSGGAHSIVLLLDIAHSMTLFEADVDLDDILNPKGVRLQLRPMVQLELHEGLHSSLALSLLSLVKEVPRQPIKIEKITPQNVLPMSQSTMLTRPYTIATLPLSVTGVGRFPYLLLLNKHHTLFLVDLHIGVAEPFAYGVAWFHVDKANVSSDPLSHFTIVTFGLGGLHLFVLPCRCASVTPMTPLAAGGGGGGSLSGSVHEGTGDTAATPPKTGSSYSRKQRAILPFLRLHIADFDYDSLPFVVLPSFGLILGGMEYVRRTWAGSRYPPLFQLHLRPTVYQHKLLLVLFSALSVSTTPTDLTGNAMIQTLTQRLRETGCFTEVMDYLMHVVLHDDLNSLFSLTAPIAVPHSTTPSESPKNEASASDAALSPTNQTAMLDRRRVLQSVLSFLRRYTEFYTVIVGCVRKTDVRKWRVIFDIIGSPKDFLDECITNGKIMEAVGYLRVLLMEGQEQGTVSLDTVAVATRRLFAIAITRSDFYVAYELFRFLSLLCVEVDLPPRSIAETPTSAIEAALRNLWPLGTRHRSSSQAQVPGFRTGSTGSFGESGKGGSDKVTRQTSLPQSSAPPSLPNSSLRALLPLQPDAEKAFNQVHSKYPELRQIIEQHGLELLRKGLVSQLCTLFEVFNLDLSLFITSKWKTLVSNKKTRSSSPVQTQAPTAATATSSTDRNSPTVSFAEDTPPRTSSGPSSSPPSSSVIAGTSNKGGGVICTSSSPSAFPHTSDASSCSRTLLPLGALFDALHREFGLPRCEGGPLSMDVVSKFPPLVRSVTQDEDARLLLDNPLRLFTPTQEYLLFVRDTFQSVTALLKVFSFHQCIPYVILLSVLLIRVEALKKLLRDHPEYSQELSAELRSSKNRGYHPLLVEIFETSK